MGSAHIRFVTAHVWVFDTYLCSAVLERCLLLVGEAGGSGMMPPSSGKPGKRNLQGKSSLVRLGVLMLIHKTFSCYLNQSVPIEHIYCAFLMFMIKVKIVSEI